MRQNNPPVFISTAQPVVGPVSRNVDEPDVSNIGTVLHAVYLISQFQALQATP